MREREGWRTHLRSGWTEAKPAVVVGVAVDEGGQYAPATKFVDASHDERATQAHSLRIRSDG